MEVLLEIALELGEEIVGSIVESLFERTKLYKKIEASNEKRREKRIMSNEAKDYERSKAYRRQGRNSELPMHEPDRYYLWW